MKLVTLTKFTQAGKSETKSELIISGVTRVIADQLIKKSPRTVADTVFVIKDI